MMLSPLGAGLNFIFCGSYNAVSFGSKPGLRPPSFYF